MKYLITTAMSQRTWDELSDAETSSPPEVQAIGDFLRAFVADLTESGELLDSVGLSAPAQARQVLLRDGVSVVTDGPYGETEEVLAGYWLVDCASFDRATEIAARLNQCPGPAPSTGVVVRPLMGDADEG